MATREATAVPVVVRDPRFGAGRALVGQRTAVDVFAALLQDAVRTYGNDTDATPRRMIETAPAYYEYGNALLRYALRQQEEEEETEEATFDAEQKPAAAVVDVRAAAAAAAERRAQEAQKDSSTTNALNNVGSVANGTKVPPVEEDAITHSEEDDDDDLQLALEMMETAWAILDDASESAVLEYRDWIVEQVPRVLTGLGDCLSALQRHADAVDAYLRALEHRQSMLEQCLEGVPTGDAPHLATSEKDIEKQLQLLKYRRQVVDVTILLVEELLACGNDADVVTTESQVVLVAKGHVIDYARGYYDRARDELQETVLLLGQVAAVTASHAALQSILQEEKENICFVATLVMGAGTTLAELDEAAAATEEEPSQKKKKPKL